jgi:signal transduction histidine kinase
LKTKRIFVRYVSHEIRTPLNTTILGLKCLESDVKQYLTEDQWNSIEDIFEDVKDACGTAVDILNDLLLYEKLDAGIFNLALTPVSLSKFVNESVKIFRAQAKANRIHLISNLDSLGLIMVNLDKSKFHQVLRNLLSNAFKFTPAHGTITVDCQIYPVQELNDHNDQIVFADIDMGRSKKIHVEKEKLFSSASHDASEKNKSRNFLNMNNNVALSSSDESDFEEGVMNPFTVEFARIAVIDTGNGINHEDQVHLFNEFIQVQADKLQNGQGSGLGLWSKETELYYIYCYNNNNNILLFV